MTETTARAPAPNAPPAPPSCDDRRIWDLWLGFYQLPTLAIADELGVFAAVARTLFRRCPRPGTTRW